MRSTSEDDRQDDRAGRQALEATSAMLGDLESSLLSNAVGAVEKAGG